MSDDKQMYLSWNTKDRAVIHRIQDYFGMKRYMTLNYLSPINIKRDDLKYPVLLEGQEKGFYRICYLPKRQ